MAGPDPIQAAGLQAQLNAALAARQAVLEYERLYAVADEYARIDRNLGQARAARSRLTPGAEGPAAVPSFDLGALAVSEASSLEYDAGELEPLLAASAAVRRFGLLRIACALRYLASLFQGAPAEAHEHELYLLALARFEALLKAGEDWPIADADWLRLRAATAPGRLRVRAAMLRSGARATAGLPLPPKLKVIEEPFLDGEFGVAALAWAVAKFSPGEAHVWKADGIADAAQALAWRDLGLHADEAGAWAAADFTPEEAAAFKTCGAEYPSTAINLREKLGDVEHLLEWHRAGFDAAKILRLRAGGVTDVKQALAQKAARQAQAEAPPPPVLEAKEPQRPAAAQVPRPEQSKPARAQEAPRPAAAQVPRPEQSKPARAQEAPRPAAAQASKPAGPVPPRTGVVAPKDGQASPPPTFRIIRPGDPSMHFQTESGAQAPKAAAPTDRQEVPSQTFGRIIRPGPAPQDPPRPAAGQASKEPEGAAPAPQYRSASLMGDTELWAQQRAVRLFGVNADSQATALSAEPAQGGAWMGWGVFEPGTSGGVGGFYEAFTLALGGGLMDVVAESEGLVMPGQGHVPRSLGASLVWQQRLDRLRLGRGAPAVPGKWHLYSWAPVRALLFWGLVFNTIGVPWGRSVDFNFNETWRQRWDRKTSESGHAGLPCPCAVEKTPQGSWWVAILPSVTSADGSVPVQIPSRAVDEEWRTQMDDFWRIMGMPAQGARWHLFGAGQAGG